MIVEVRADDMRSAFLTLRSVLPSPPRGPARQFYDLDGIRLALQALRRPLGEAKIDGNLINPWALARLGHDEVRNASALAGLWEHNLGGDAARAFLASFLAIVMPQVDWQAELEAGYQVATEVCPLGDTGDRVDLVIESARHLIGIEIKIRAALGPDQLVRYVSAIARRARLVNREPMVILLAPFKSDHVQVSSTSWADVAQAAHCAIGRKISERTFMQQLIASFGDHVRHF